MGEISWDKYVVLEYRLRLASGEFIRGSEGAPAVLTFIAGYKELLPALERRLWGLKEQETVDFVIPKAEAFGDYDPKNVQSWSHKVFPADMDLKPGKWVVPANLPFPPEYPLVIKEVTEKEVVLDLNHPLAGQDLHYSVKVLEVRPATPEELEPLQKCQACREEMESQGGA